MNLSPALPKDPVEHALLSALHHAMGDECSPRLREALMHAVFPGGGRLRPRLVLAAARAVGAGGSPLAAAGAVAVELIHCATLVHDDMPCFDDAILRRGRPTVHRAFGEPMALLVGDGLIVEAFATVARASAGAEVRAMEAIAALGRASGVARGVVYGQAQELEASTDVASYHAAKTGALFEVALALGAIAGGVAPAPFARVGAEIGAVYQLYDDLCDVVGDEATLGKPTGQDEAHDRPSLVAERGVSGASALLLERLDALDGSVPDCEHRHELEGEVRALTAKLRAIIPASAPRAHVRAAVSAC